MKLSVLGATGQTGQFLVRQALEQGHMVTAIVRTPSKLTVQHDNLKVVEANIFSEDSLVEHFKEQDAVLSCLGFPLSIFSRATGYTDSMKAVVVAMRQAKVNRMITMTSWYTKPESARKASLFVQYLVVPVIHNLLINMDEMENYLSEQCDDLNWTAVKPPGLRNGPATDKEILTNDGYFVPGPDGNPLGDSVSRGDVARFMLSLLNGDLWMKKAVAMTTK
ncbi:flavin reductase (NADPH) [Callorhinchus milii]|uniref:Flavin reductase (NADPH)-like n=1 Tax=Callorhinchus milii TaxID=7868 RepID=V9L0A7_CALMI|nr:flavin reductase (NADPH) [Callorhinchus milii]XP_042196194.1 flavin reductase (NADPH) [Callorhinchus milii]XP_042196201.1 flavin reductase (NADPH) [Callorhinchus milii]|eukprot:gi/632958574/ref/XP_007895120.1/ PREDICTED: flavin reductase (NADPH)-like [Callorhinchus milii]